MTFHPHGKIGTEGVDQLVRMLVAMHSLALVSTLLMFLAMCGFTRRVSGPDRLAFAALVLFGFACVAVMNAAVLDGLVAPNVIRQMVAAQGSGHELWQGFMRYNFEMNQANARVYAVASGLAIALWSSAMLKNWKPGKSIAIYGWIYGAAVTVLIGSGVLTPDLHGFGLVVLGQAIWFLFVAGKLWSDRSTEAAA